MGGVTSDVVFDGGPGTHDSPPPVASILLRPHCQLSYRAVWQATFPFFGSFLYNGNPNHL